MFSSHSKLMSCPAPPARPAPRSRARVAEGRERRPLCLVSVRPPVLVCPVACPCPRVVALCAAASWATTEEIPSGFDGARPVAG